MQLHNDAQAEFDRLAANPVRPGLPDAGALSAGTAEILVMTSTGMPDSAIAQCLGDLDRRAGDEARGTRPLHGVPAPVPADTRPLWRRQPTASQAPLTAERLRHVLARAPRPRVSERIGGLWPGGRAVCRSGRSVLPDVSVAMKSTAASADGRQAPRPGARHLHRQRRRARLPAAGQALCGPGAPPLRRRPAPGRSIRRRRGDCWSAS